MLPNQSLVADLTYLEIGGCYITHLIVAVYEANRTVTGNLSLPKPRGNLYAAHISIPLHTNIPCPSILEVKSVKLTFISNLRATPFWLVSE